MNDQSAEREWARNNGYAVGDRGRLASTIVNAYNARCRECEKPKNQHRTWCSRYDHNNAEGTNMTTTTTTIAPTATYCRECWETLPAHTADCSLAVTVDDPEWAATPDVTPIPATSSPVVTEPASAIERAIAELVSRVTPNAAPVDAEQVREIVREEWKNTESAILEMVSDATAPKVYNIHIPARETVTIDGATHRDFERVVKIVGVGVHAYLVGPPGTGKTTLAGQVASALGLAFGAIQCDPTMPASKLFGFIDAGGTYRGTVFRDCYENGGVYLFDEIDNAHPGIIASINGAIANGHCAFPDGMIARHADFRCIAAANTYGTGATRAFVGRNELDAATLDRFATVVVEIDEALEESLTMSALPDNAPLAKEWLAKVRGWRRSVGDLKVIISPRASIEGAKLLSVGFSMDEAAEMKVWKGTDAATRAKIERGY